MFTKFVFIFLFVSFSSFALESSDFKKMITEAEKVNSLSGTAKQEQAIEVIKNGFKTVRANQKDIPGNQAPGLKNRLRKIYQDVKANKYQSFNEALEEGKNYLLVYETAGNLFK